MNENEIGEIVVGCAIEVHRLLGPGLLETVYEQVLAKRLVDRGLEVISQVEIPIECDGIQFAVGFRADLVVMNKVIVELKSVEQLSRVHYKQVLTYLRLSGMKLGYLLNFGRPVMKSGIARIINGTIEPPMSMP